MPDNNWTLISGSTPQDYTDTAVFEVNPDTKQIALITGQALVAGEKDSQYISFLMPRYWDGIDISDKSFTVEYALAGTYYGTSEAVNAEMTTEQVRFGWVVPETACAISGTLLFVLKITSEDYVLKTQIAEHPVFKTIRVEDVVPEPTKEAWYREFQTRVNGAISEAEAAVETAQSTLTQVEVAAQLVQTAATEAQTAQVAVEAASQSAQTSAQVAQVSQEAAEAAAAIAQIRYGSPLVAQIADEMVEQNRVYVYTGSETGYTAGHWYYYDGTAWVSGGVYNGTGINTDTTLTQAGMAADAKATGDEISQIFIIVAKKQHESTFYGLAKAAGHDEKNSTLPVGEYTEEAKIAIQKMLGIYEPPYELLNDFTLEEDTGFNVTADMNGIPYDLRNVLIWVTYPANLASVARGYGRYRCFDSNGKSTNAETGRYSANTVSMFKYITVERKANLAFLYFTNQQETDGSVTWRSENMNTSGVQAGISIDLGNITRIACVDPEPAGTQIKIFGQRAY